MKRWTYVWTISLKKPASEVKILSKNENPSENLEIVFLQIQMTNYNKYDPYYKYYKLHITVHSTIYV